MAKYIPIIILILFAFIIYNGSTDKLQPTEFIESTALGSGSYTSDVRVEEHYGCEYIVVDTYTKGPGGITHKGNCKFCVKKDKNEK